METKEQRFSRVVEEYKRTIYTVCYMFSKDEDEVNDLFQEILIRLWQGFDSFEGKSDIKTWIYRVSLNYCINYDKKQKRAGDRVGLDMDIKPYEDNYEKSLQVKRLYKRINALGLADRSVILLWLEGLSYDEIGAILGISAKHPVKRMPLRATKSKEGVLTQGQPYAPAWGYDWSSDTTRRILGFSCALTWSIVPRTVAAVMASPFRIIAEAQNRHPVPGGR